MSQLGSTLQGFRRSFLCALFNYDRRTGLVTRNIARGGYPAGTVVGTVDGKGYLHVNINRKFVLLHRLAWLIETGDTPVGIDHRNRLQRDNRWLNLRPCTQVGNMGNTLLSSHNSSGYKGVSRNRKSGKWHTQIKVHGKQTYAGRDDCPHIAALLYNAVAVAHFGEFATFNLLGSNELNARNLFEVDLFT